MVHPAVEPCLYQYSPFVMQEDQFWLLVSLKLSGEATEEELAALDALLKEHPEMGLRLDVLNIVWMQQQPAPRDRKKDTLNKHLQRLSHHLSEPVLQYENSQSPQIVFRDAENPVGNAPPPEVVPACHRHSCLSDRSFPFCLFFTGPFEKGHRAMRTKYGKHEAGIQIEGPAAGWFAGMAECR